MRVLRAEPHTNQGVPFLLLDDADQPISIVSAFLRYLSSRDCSPNTLRSYIYDLLHFMTFLQGHSLTYEEFTPAKSLIFLDYLRHLPSRRRVSRANGKQGEAENQRGQSLSASTINRIFATISSFYEYLIVSEQFTRTSGHFLLYTSRLGQANLLDLKCRVGSGHRLHKESGQNGNPQILREIKSTAQIVFHGMTLRGVL